MYSEKIVFGLKFDKELPDSKQFFLSKLSENASSLETDIIRWKKREQNITWFFCFLGVNIEDDLHTT